MTTTTYGSSSVPKSDPVYLMGRNDPEARRLILQARLYEPSTRWLLERAGIRRGMTVLDLGSGTGDVALLARELVGPEGAVVGVDQNPEILELARARTVAAGYDNVRFVTGDVADLTLDHQVDAVVGRLVLMYVGDRAAALDNVVRHLRPGGVLVFQEMHFTPHTCQADPALPVWDALWSWMCDAARAAGIETAMGYRMPQLLRAAGLVGGQFQLTAGVGSGPDDPVYEFAAESLRSMLPLIIATGVATAAEVGIETLADRLRAAALEADATVKYPDLVGGWATKP